MHPSGNQRPRESRSHELERWKTGTETRADRREERRREATKRADARGFVDSKIVFISSTIRFV